MRLLLQHLKALALHSDASRVGRSSVTRASFSPAFSVPRLPAHADPPEPPQSAGKHGRADQASSSLAGSASASALSGGHADGDASSSKKAVHVGFGRGPVGTVAATLVWYGLTVVYSVYNTAVLQLFPFPLTVLTAELAAGVLLILPAWVLGVIRTPNLRMSQAGVMVVTRVVWSRLACWNAGRSYFCCLVEKEKKCRGCREMRDGFNLFEC